MAHSSRDTLYIYIYIYIMITIIIWINCRQGHRLPPQNFSPPNEFRDIILNKISVLPVLYVVKTVPSSHCTQQIFYSWTTSLPNPVSHPVCWFNNISCALFQWGNCKSCCVAEWGIRHLFRSVFYDWSTASSKAGSPKSAIYCFHF